MLAGSCGHLSMMPAVTTDGVPVAVEPIRVLVLHPRDLGAPTMGGIQTFLQDFVKFSPDDFEITVAGVTQDQARRPIGRRTKVAIDGRAAWFLPLAPASGMPLNPLKLLAMAAAQIRLRRDMLRPNTILQMHRPYRPVFLAGHRGPRVQFVHVDIREWPGPSGWSRLRGLYRQFSDTALRQMARVVVVNEAGAAILRQDHPQIADRVDFLPVWFDDAVFRPPRAAERTAARAQLPSRLGLGTEAEQDKIVLLAGRLDPVKDPILAVDGFAELIRVQPSARLLICGDGPRREEMEGRVQELGIVDRVHFMGDLARDELAAVMRACDVLVLTSLAEGGGPRVVLEALASGLPVVAMPVGEVRRTVEHQVNGWLVDERTPTAVARGLSWILDRPAGKLGEAAVAAAAPYNARAVLAGLYETYRRLAANPR